MTPDTPAKFDLEAAKRAARQHLQRCDDAGRLSNLLYHTLDVLESERAEHAKAIEAAKIVQREADAKIIKQSGEIIYMRCGRKPHDKLWVELHDSERAKWQQFAATGAAIICAAPLATQASPNSDEGEKG